MGAHAATRSGATHGIELRMFHVFRCMCFTYFIWMLHGLIRMLYVFHLDVASVSVAITYVVSVHSKCFICFRRMPQVFYLDVAWFHPDGVCVLSGCCICYKCMFQMFHQF
jgi:hypothetical protein